MNILNPLQIIALIIALIILVAIMLVLYYKNKKLHEELKHEKERFYLYKEGISKLKQSDFKDPKKDLQTLNKYARNFFKEYFSLDFSLTYLELEAELKNLNKPKYAEFCKLMSMTNYKSEIPDTQNIKKLISLFSELLEEY